MSTKKIFGGLVAIVAAFAVFSTVSAQTATYTFTTDLTIGSTGADVVALQSFLESKGMLVIPAGTTKGYFGALTQSALAKFQAANGISPAAGYFGPITRASVNSMNMGMGTGTTMANPCPTGFVSGTFNGVKVCLMGTGTTKPSDDNDDDDDSDSDDNDDDSDSDDLKGGETSLEDFDVRTGDDSDPEEGDDKAEVMEIRFDVEDADARIERVDVNFEFTGTTDGEDKPWKVFDKAYLMMDGEEIASMDTDDEDDFDEVDEDDDTYRLRFNDVDEVVKEGDEAKITLALDIADSVDGSEDGATSYDLYVSGDEDDGGVRVTDEEDIDSSIGDEDDTIEVTIDQEGEDEELTIRDADDEVDGGTIEVDDDSTSDWEDLLAFEFEAEESDIEVNELPVTFRFSSSTAGAFDRIIDDLELVVDGETFDDYDVGSSTTSGTGLNGSTTVVVTFNMDDDELKIKKDDSQDATIRAKFNRADTAQTFQDGQTVEVDITSANVDAIDAEGEDDLDGTQLNGSADGELFTLSSSGIMVDAKNTSATRVFNSDQNNTDDQGEFVIEFDVTAFEDDAFIDLTAVRSSSTTPFDGVGYVIENSSNGEIVTGTSTASLERIGSAGDENGGVVTVNEDETVRFRLTVDFDAAVTGFYRLQLVSVNSDNDNTGTSNSQDRVSPEEDFQTGSVQVLNQ